MISIYLGPQKVSLEASFTRPSKHPASHFQDGCFCVKDKQAFSVFFPAAQFNARWLCVIFKACLPYPHRMHTISDVIIEFTIAKKEKNSFEVTILATHE